jgi:hypothetical protein
MDFPPAGKRRDRRGGIYGGKSPNFQAPEWRLSRAASLSSRSRGFALIPQERQ